MAYLMPCLDGSISGSVRKIAWICDVLQYAFACVVVRVFVCHDVMDEAFFMADVFWLYVRGVHDQKES